MGGREIRSLTGLRGVAAVYVVLFHFFLGIGTAGFLARFVTHGYLSVDLFFVLSGFVMAKTYGDTFSKPTLRNYGHFLGKRLARIYPLYAVACLAASALAVVGLLSIRPNSPFGLTLAANLLLVQNWVGLTSMNPATWSLSTEWAAYLVFPLLMAPRLWRSSLSWAAIPLVCLLVTGYAFYGRLPHAVGVADVANALSTLMRCLSEFTLGIWVSRIWTARNARFQKAEQRLQVLVAIILLVALVLPKTELVMVTLFPVLVGTLASDRGPLCRALSARPCHILGELSYSLYLLHPLTYWMIGATHHFVNRHGLKHGQTYGAVLAVVVLCVATPLSYKFIEAPGRDLVRGWLQERRPLAPPKEGAIS